MLHDSLAVGSRLDTAIAATDNPEHRNASRQTMMALHSHMNNIFDLLEVQQHTQLYNYRTTHTGHYILHAQFFNDLLDRCIRYGTQIYSSISISAKTNKHRELLTKLIYKLDRFIRFKIVPHATSPLSKYISQFKYPKRTGAISFFESISQEKTFESPLINSLRNNYYFPLIDEADLEQIQEEHSTMTSLSPLQDESLNPAVTTTASVNQVSTLFHTINADENLLDEDEEEMILENELPSDRPQVKEYRMRFTIFRKKGYAPSSLSQVKIFQDFISTIKSIDNDVQILPIENKEIKAISNDRQLRQIDPSTIHHFFKAQNPSHQTITGEFHISATRPYKELMAHQDMKTWFAYHCYGHKYSEHQVSPMIRIGFLTRVRAITYRDGLRDFIMKHPLWDTNQYPAFHFTFHFRTLRVRQPKTMQTMVLNINAEKIHLETACSFFQELFDGKRIDSSPNEIPYTFIPTHGNFFTELDIPKILHDNEKHTTAYGVILINGLNSLDTKVGLKNHTCTTIRTILNSLPPGKGSDSPTLFQQVEQQPNTDWVVCVFNTANRESVHQRLHLIEIEIKRILKDEEIERTFVGEFKISGMKMPASTKNQPRLRTQNVSSSALLHTKQILSTLATPPAKRAFTHSDTTHPTRTYAQSVTTETFEGTPTTPIPNNTSIITNNAHTHMEARMTSMENHLKTNDARLTKIEHTCDELKTMCGNTLDVLQRLTANHEQMAYHRDDNLHHKHIRPTENSVTCDTPMPNVAAAHP
jgi:hypothetical protein